MLDRSGCVFGGWRHLLVLSDGSVRMKLNSTQLYIDLLQLPHLSLSCRDQLSSLHLCPPIFTPSPLSLSSTSPSSLTRHHSCLATLRPCKQCRGMNQTSRASLVFLDLFFSCWHLSWSSSSIHTLQDNSSLCSFGYNPFILNNIVLTKRWSEVSQTYLEGKTKVKREIWAATNNYFFTID